MTVRILTGDCRDRLAELETGSVRCCVTSPPYFGLRSYLPVEHAGKGAEIGAERAPETYVAALVEVFRQVRRVLTHDGTVWLNVGDSYAGVGGKGQPHRNNSGGFSGSDGGRTQSYALAGGGFNRPRSTGDGIKPKDLLMIPARVALALQADGWWLRSSIVWHKPNAMPESVRDRPTSAHESVFLLAKSERYYYDAKAVSEPAINGERYHGAYDKRPGAIRERNGRHDADNVTTTRNARNVWTIATQPYAGAHCAVMPPALAERCIRAGSAPGDTILDPFLGAGTTALVAARLGRHCVGIELNPASAAEARARIEGDGGMFAAVAAE